MPKRDVVVFVLLALFVVRGKREKLFEATAIAGSVCQGVVLPNLSQQRADGVRSARSERRS